MFSVGGTTNGDATETQVKERASIQQLRGDWGGNKEGRSDGSGHQDRREDLNHKAKTYVCTAPIRGGRRVWEIGRENWMGVMGHGKTTG